MHNKTLPLALLKDLKLLLVEVRKIVNDHSDILEIRSQEDFTTQIWDKEHPHLPSPIQNPPCQKRGKMFYSDFFPLSESQYQTASYFTEKDEVIDMLESWVAMILEYNSINLQEDDQIPNFYAGYSGAC